MSGRSQSPDPYRQVRGLQVALLGSRLQQVEEWLLLEVPGPAERGGVEVPIAQLRTGAEFKQFRGQVQVAACGGDVQCGVPRQTNRGVAAATNASAGMSRVWLPPSASSWAASSRWPFSCAVLSSARGLPPSSTLGAS